MGKRNEVIELIAKNEGITISQFANVLKKPAANLYDIQSGKLKGVSEKLADTIIEQYPHYSKTWLMTGEGEMLTCNTVTGNNNTVGNINSTDALLHAIDEIAAQRKMVEKSQQQIDKLLQQQQLLIETIAKKT